jgi:hypothetical protein
MFAYARAMSLDVPRKGRRGPRTIHRPDCREIPYDVILELQSAGTAIRHDVAPRACRTCQPEVEVRLGV